MAEGLSNMNDKKEAVPDGEDRLSALPEDVIGLLLSFLPSREAVQTCVLATRWRNLWKSVPSLRIDMGYVSTGSANFVNSLLRNRRGTPLHECEIFFVDHDNMDESHRDAELLLRYAVSCEVRVLRFDILYHRLQLSAGSLVSKHLTRLILHHVLFEDFSLDVLTCQSLEVLELHHCVINIGTDFPKPLQLLRIIRTSFLPEDTRSFISAPGLVTLELAFGLQLIPLLKRLPSLVTAFIHIGFDCTDSSQTSYGGDCGHGSSVESYGIGDCVLVKGLSDATHLQLKSHCSMILRKDITWCPMFSKLKTLLLGAWCLAGNFSGLVYFLQHSPVLEMLTLQFSIFSKKIKASKVYKPEKEFLVSKHLKAVEIKYCKEIGKIDQILNVLAYHGVQPELINTKKKFYIDCLGYECLE